MDEEGNGTIPTPEEVQEALGTDDTLDGLTPEEVAVAAKILPRIAEKANRQAEANKARQFRETMEELKKQNTKYLEEKVEEFKKALTPPTEEEISNVLNQEYAEFTVSVKAKDNGTRKLMHFIIRELPMEAEARIVREVKRTMSDRLAEVARIKWIPGSNVLENIERLATVIPGAMETFADCAAICLDPFGEQNIDGKWVMTNMGVTRMAGVLQAQLQAGRYRDFFSQLSRSIQQMNLM